MVSIGDFEGGINDGLMNLPMNTSSIVSGTPSKNTKNDGEQGWFDVVIQMAPCVSVVLYTFAYGAGFGPAMYTWTSEIFPSNMKGVGSSIVFARYYITPVIELHF